jgi:hypothetical protein
LLKLNNSITSTLDGMDSFVSSSEPTPAQMISEQQVQAGCFKTGVRYCLETWPNNFILQVGFCHRSWLDHSKPTVLYQGSAQKACISCKLHQARLVSTLFTRNNFNATLSFHGPAQWQLGTAERLTPDTMYRCCCNSSGILAAAGGSAIFCLLPRLLTAHPNCPAAAHVPACHCILH